MYEVHTDKGVCVAYARSLSEAMKIANHFKKDNDGRNFKVVELKDVYTTSTLGEVLKSENVYEREIK